MKARRLAEIRQLVVSPEFREWFAAVAQARAEVARARERRDALLDEASLSTFRSELDQKAAIESLDRSGDLEDTSAGMLAEAMELENQGLDLVAHFEEQRFRASEAWMEACSAERRVDSLREQVAALRGRGDRGEASRLEAELRRADRAHAEAQAIDARERATKDRLWDEAERHWASSMELSLRIAELRVQSRRLRSEAERLLRSGEQRRTGAERLNAEAQAAGCAFASAQAQLGALLRGSVETFGALPGDSFIYFRQREDPRASWCVALEEDAQSYNVEVRPQAIYAVEPRRGVDLLEPAVERQDTTAEGDRRFEAWFLEGREGRAHAGEASSNSTPATAGRRAGQA